MRAEEACEEGETVLLRMDAQWALHTGEGLQIYSMYQPNPNMVLPASQVPLSDPFDGWINLQMGTPECTNCFQFLDYVEDGWHGGYLKELQ